jgi:uncharacterized protein YbaP (TraB family)
MRFSFFIVISIMASSGSQAQQKQSVLWKISGIGLKRPSYLLGTVHVMPASVINGFPELQKIMQLSERGLFEGVENSIAMGPELEKKLYPPLDSVFSPEQYAIVDSFFVNHKSTSPREYNNNASLLAMLQLAVRLKEFDNSQTGYDDSLTNFMNSYNKPVTHLDNPDLFAKKLLEVWPPQIIANELVNYITGNTGPLWKTAIDAQIDQQSLTANLHLDSPSPAVRSTQALVNERTLIWLAQIESHIKTEPCFIAVGLGHLEYKQGLIGLLRQKGYKLTPVTLTKGKK